MHVLTLLPLCSLQVYDLFSCRIVQAELGVAKLLACFLLPSRVRPLERDGVRALLQEGLTLSPESRLMSWRYQVLHRAYDIQVLHKGTCT